MHVCSDHVDNGQSTAISNQSADLVGGGGGGESTRYTLTSMFSFTSHKKFMIL